MASYALYTQWLCLLLLEAYIAPIPCSLFHFCPNLARLPHCVDNFLLVKVCAFAAGLPPGSVRLLCCGQEKMACHLYLPALQTPISYSLVRSHSRRKKKTFLLWQPGYEASEGHEMHVYQKKCRCYKVKVEKNKKAGSCQELNQDTSGLHEHQCSARPLAFFI